MEGMVARGHGYRTAIALLLVAGCGGISNSPPSIAQTSALVATTPATETSVIMRTIPDATCSLHETATGGGLSLTLFSDDKGLVRFSASQPLSTLASLGFMLDCEASNGAVLDSQSVGPGSMVPDAGPVGITIPPSVDDPTAFTTDQLAQLGYPPKPNPAVAPADYVRWLQFVSRPRIAVSNTAIPHPDHLRLAQYLDPAWGGYVIAAPNTTYDSVSGIFTVPNVTSHGFPSVSGTLYAALWAGMDGTYGSLDVVQAGVLMNVLVRCAFPFLPCVAAAGYYAIVAWDPDSAIAIPNLSVSPGDIVEIVVDMRKWVGNVQVLDRTTLRYTAYNFTKNTQTSGCIGPPSNGCTTSPTHNQSYVGNTAEWIMERPGVNNVLYPLPDFATTQMTGAIARDANSNVLHSVLSEPYDQHILQVGADVLAGVNLVPGSPTIDYTWQAYQ
jgi:hypothetical protein